MLCVRMPNKTLERNSEDLDEVPVLADHWRSEDVIGQLSRIYNNRFLDLSVHIDWNERGHSVRSDSLEMPADLKQFILLVLRNDAKTVEGAADAWLRAFDLWLTSLPTGKVVVVDLLTGDFVTAWSRIEALDAFEKEFGSGRTVGWLHEIGGGAVLGGGLA